MTSGLAARHPPQRRGRMLCQSKVPTDTMIITATSAAIGMTRDDVAEHDAQHQQERRRRGTSRCRVRAPEAFTLIIVWPIIAQPPMPPKKPVTMLATPWPERLAGLVGVGVGDVVDELGGHQRLQQPDQRHGQRVRAR